MVSKRDGKANVTWYDTQVKWQVKVLCKSRREDGEMRCVTGISGEIERTKK